MSGAATALGRTGIVVAGHRESPSTPPEPDQADTLPPPPRRPTGGGPSTPLGSLYVLLAEIGQGATGRVWHGRRRADDAPVAVKMLRREYAQDPEVVARFVRQRTLLCSLTHPHLVRVHDLVAEGGVLAVVMDYVAGTDLRRLTSRQRLRPDQIYRMLEQVASALAACHAAGIVHRDVKPENVLVRMAHGSPHALLTDFGLAGATTGPSDLTQLSQLMGTPAYVAPEVVAGRPASPATDVYALGVMAYELLAGERPFAAAQAESTAALLQAQVSADPPRPAELTPPEWELLCAMLAKDPAQRPAATDVVQRVRRLRGPDAPPPLPPPPPGSSEPEPAAPAPELAPPEAGSVGASGSAAWAGPLASAALPEAGSVSAAEAGSVPAAAQPTLGATRPVAPAPSPPPRRGRWRRLVVAGAVAALLGTAGGLYLGRPDAAREPDPEPADPPVQMVEFPLQVLAVSPEPGVIQLSFPDATNLSGFQRYLIHRGNELLDVVSPDELVDQRYVIPLVDPDTPYCYRVSALLETDHPPVPVSPDSDTCRKADGRDA